jgi:hypothetical protein
MIFMRFLLIIIVLAFAVISSAASVENGNFESARDGQPVGWKALGSGVSVKSFTREGWKQGELLFNSGEYNVIRVYLGIQGGTGTIWFDNVDIDESTSSRLVVANKSFEEGDANTLAGWDQDSAGERTVRDTSVWTRFPGQGFGSGASARVTGTDGKRARIWQDVGGKRSKEYPFRPGKPNTDYVISFEWRAEDLKGELYVEVYGVEADGKLGRALPNKPLASKFPAKRFGEKIVALTLTASGETSLSQQVKLPSEDLNRPLRVTAQVRIPKLSNGSVALSVETGGVPESASITEITRSDDLWQEISVNFVPDGADARIAIRMKASEGDSDPAGLVYVDNVTIGPASITPMPKRLEWLSLDKSFPIPEKLSVGIEDEVNTAVESAIRLFSESLKERTGTVVVSESPLGADEPGVELVVAPKDEIEREPESYSLSVSRNRVKIISADERGALYGLMTLLKLIQQAPSGGHIFLAASIDDAPDLPFRGVFPVPSHPGSRFHEVIDRLARLRFNAAAFGVDAFKFDVYQDPEMRRRIEDLFAYCRGLGIEPIPILQSGGWASRQVEIDPNIAEGSEVVDEKLVLIGTEPVALAHTNVIRTESSDIGITDNTGTRTYEEGNDYEVLGKIEVADWTVGFSSDAPPFQLRLRLGRGRIGQLSNLPQRAAAVSHHG